MTDTNEDAEIELTKEIEIVFQQGKSALEEITKKTDISKRLRYRLTISFLSMLITEAGSELYPIFRKHELMGFFKRINECITEMAESTYENEGDDINPEDAEKLSKALAGMAEDLISGSCKVKVSKACIE